MFKKIVLTLSILFCAAAAINAKTVTYDNMGVKITAVPVFSGKIINGYSFYSIIATNNSGEEREIRLTMRTTYSSELEQISRKFKLSNGETRVESLFFPMMSFSSDGMKVEVDGVPIRDKVFPYVSIYPDYYRKKQALVDNRLARSEFESVFGSSRSGPYDLEMCQFEGGVDQLDSRWLFYSRFDALVFYADSLAKMSNEIRAGIFDYIRAGGRMLVLGDFQPPEDFKPGRLNNIAGVSSFKGFTSGFGKLICVAADTLTTVATASGNPFPDLVDEPLGRVSGRSTFPLRFHDTELANVSVQWLMIVIYAFAFLIGPVNVYVLHKIGRKIWVFWTVPLASAVCCFFIFTYYWIFESSQLLVKKQALTFLDERSNRAITLANMAVFSSSSRSEGFKFSFDTEVRPTFERSYRSNDGGKIINLDDDQRFAEGWIRPKVPRYLHMRSVQRRRERLTVEGSGSDLQVLNGLGADIKVVYVMMPDGKAYECNNLKSGSRGPLNLAMRFHGSKKHVGSKEMVEVFSREWYDEYRGLYQNPERVLQPGMYIAQLDGTPFMEKQTFENAGSQEDSVVVGIMGGNS